MWCAGGVLRFYIPTCILRTCYTSCTSCTSCASCTVEVGDSPRKTHSAAARLFDQPLDGVLSFARGCFLFLARLGVCREGLYSRLTPYYSTTTSTKSNIISYEIDVPTLCVYSALLQQRISSSFESKENRYLGRYLLMLCNLPSSSPFEA